MAIPRSSIGRDTRGDEAGSTAHDDIDGMKSSPSLRPAHGIS
jgi:hypothetical protein